MKDDENERDLKNILPQMRELASIVDFSLSFVRFISDSLEKFVKQFSLIPQSENLWEVIKVLAHSQISLQIFLEAHPGNLTVAEKSNEELRKKLLEAHGALGYAHADSYFLLLHSLGSACTSYYTVAYMELRGAIESLLRGVIFDALAYPQFRNSADELKEIPPYTPNAAGFSDLIRKINDKFSSERVFNSAEILDLIEELSNFNPRVLVGKLLCQLIEWELIDEKTKDLFLKYYEKLSKYVHRISPRFSEPGIRVQADRNWADREPVIKEFIEYIHTFVDVTGVLLVPQLNLYKRDFWEENFQAIIDWNALSNILDESSEIAKDSESWKIAKGVIEELLKAPSQ